MISINSKKATEFLGRNGTFKCAGFTMLKMGHERNVVSGGSVMIWPITSKGVDGRCFIEVAVDDLEEFIRALR